MPALERPLTVVYTVFGSASNGVDYTELSGVLEVPANSSSAQITVDPIYDTELEFEEPVTVSLVLTNGYLVQRDLSTATIFISDRIDTNVFTVVASNVPSPVEIQYHQPTDSLLLSVNYDTSGAQGNFLRLDSLGHSNGWSSVSELYEEVKFAVPRTTATGWTNGCMFFGRETQIAYLSEDAAEVVPTWCTLTNEVVTNALYLRGSLCFDETGVWSNDLIVATSDNTPDSTTRKGVWCVDAKGTPKLIANIDTDHLEGVISIPNDAARWGPWAGKILTGDESLKDENSKSTPLLYAVDMSGKTTTYNLGIQAEDFDLIPADQDLYCVNFNNYQSKVLKISRNLLSNFVGDLLITQAGEYNLPPSLVWAPKLFIVHWDGANFVTRSITLPSDTFPGTFEHVTFAPVALPNL